MQIFVVGRFLKANQTQACDDLGAFLCLDERTEDDVILAPIS